MSPEKLEATRDYQEACERFEELLVQAPGALNLEAACYVAGELHGCFDFDTYTSVPDLVEQAKRALRGADADLVNECNQCLQVMLCSAWAIEEAR